MASIGKIYGYGKEAVGNNWDYINRRNTNRLYYIHGGKGTYILGKTEYEFIPEKLYFLPYTAEIYPKSNPENPLLHTYADFELIPPVISDRPAIFSPETDKMMYAAYRVFLEGAELRNGKSDELFFAAVKYLVCRGAEICGFTFLNDEIIIDALEYMIEHISENINIGVLAKRYFMTADSFIRRFSNAVCVTPYAWLKNTRIKTARSLLNDGKTLAQTAAAVGYSDASSLLHALAGEKKQL